MRLARFLAAASTTALVLSLLAVPAVATDDADPGPRHEIWALDQGEDLNRIHVYDEGLDEVAVIELDEHLQTPHMIDFDAAHRYAVVAGTTGQGVAIIRTADYELVEVIHTGAGAHMAAVTPDDSAIWVANIGTRTFTEIVPDWEAETFSIGRELDVRDDPAWQVEFGDVDPEPAPVCHEYTADGQFAYLTLGPGPGGLVVVDITSDEPEIVKAFSRDDVKANCGLALTDDGAKMYANWGDPGDPDGEDDTGEWYVFDTSDHTLVGEGRETRGIDAHGVRITPDGTELWQVNRGTSNGIVVDTATDEIIDEIDFTGDAPDILDFSPDGTRAYISLRGPNPLTGAPHVATGTTPGFAVVDVATREVLEVVEPAVGTGDHDASDFHGLGVRVIHDVTRIAGDDRIETAIAISRASFADGAATGAVLARSTDFPDALAGAALAAHVGGPVLLTPSRSLPEAVADELLRILPETAEVSVLGGTEALSGDVEDAVNALGFDTDRIDGETRFETAAAIAESIGEPAALLVTTGLDFADAVTAGAAAASSGGAVLLTPPDRPHDATDAALAAHDDADVFAVGGPAARGYPDAQPLVGDTRFETALAVADAFFDAPEAIGLARADAFPDALAGGPHAASVGGPLLLTPTSSLHATVAVYLCDAPVRTVYAYGGPNAIRADVLHAAQSHVLGDAC